MSEAALRRWHLVHPSSAPAPAPPPAARVALAPRGELAAAALLAHPESIVYALERAHGGHWLPQELQARKDALRKGQGSLTHQLERLTEAY